ncbi:hypothetical protein [Chryseobacterium sp.]|uniref:hypothetical protein n=1 Tax=Chryseobacterium sp. TaxID=1871047 RepID=UPI00289D6803|nr:hypothetical protein [Chryseobacterium sp.]
MKTKIFKYKSITTLVFVYGFIMLFVFGFATFDTYNLFKNESEITPGEYFISVFLGIMFLLGVFSLFMLAIKSNKSIFILNIFLGLNTLLFIAALIIIKLDKDQDSSVSDKTILILFGIPVFLIFLINKYKNREVQYENVDLIGKHED